MNIKKIIRRSLEELWATKEIVETISVGAGISTLLAKIDIQRVARKGIQETKKMEQRLVRKHEVLLAYFDDLFSDYIPCANAETCPGGG